MNDIDIWRAANLLVKRHGQEASTYASQQAEKLLNAGDPDGSQVWKRIMNAAEELLRTTRRNDESLN